MIGRFLEISVHASDVLDSLRFYEALGFRQLNVGEVWSHPYAVVSDGRAVVGLHGYAFDSPAITFVLQSLAAKLRHLETHQGLRFAFAKTGDDEFNEAGFVTPAGQMVALLEARTYSPPAFDDQDFSLLGRLLDFVVPAADVETETAFWEGIGLRRAGGQDSPYPWATLSAEDLAIGIHQRPPRRQAALRYACRDLGTLVMRLDDGEIAWTECELPGAARAIQFHAPDGLVLLAQSSE